VSVKFCKHLNCKLTKVCDVDRSGHWSELNGCPKTSSFELNHLLLSKFNICWGGLRWCRPCEGRFIIHKSTT